MGKGRSTFAGLLTWAVSLVVYCIVQTLANVTNVILQDILLLCLPVAAASATTVALRIAPRLWILLRIAVGGVGSCAFAALYEMYFQRVIVETYHLWQRNEGNLQPTMGFVGLLVLTSIPLGMIGGAWLGSNQTRIEQKQS